MFTATQHLPGMQHRSVSPASHSDEQFFPCRGSAQQKLLSTSQHLPPSLHLNALPQVAALGAAVVVTLALGVVSIVFVVIAVVVVTSVLAANSGASTTTHATQSHRRIML